VPFAESGFRPVAAGGKAGKQGNDNECRLKSGVFH
jgi:hypothetical protein